MPNPRRTTTPGKKRKRNEHVASEEIRQQARQSGAKAVRTVAEAATKAVTHTPRATQTSVQPRNTVNRPTASTQNKPASNTPKKASTSLAKANKQAKKFKPRVKITNTSAKSQYGEFKKSGLAYKTQEERKKEKIDYTKAYQKSQKVGDLLTGPKRTDKVDTDGGKAQRALKTGALELGKEGEKKATYKSKEWKQAKKDIEKDVKKGYKKHLKKEGWTDDEIKYFLNSEQGKKYVKQDTKSAIKDAKKNVNKEIDKAYNKRIKKVNSKDNTLKSQNLSSEDYLRLQIAQQQFGGDVKKVNAALGKKRAEKIGSRTAYSAFKGKAATGAMQGLSYVDVFSGGGTYNKAAKKAIKKTKSSGAYLAGYGAGLAGQFALGGTNALGRSIAKTGGKAAAKSAGKKFVRNRAGELVAETPTNLVDAAKMSMDENGKIDKKEFAKWMAVNTGFTGGMGAAMEGIGGAITKKQASNMKKLLAKQQAKTITEEETKQLDNVLSKLKKKANNKENISSNIAEKGLEGRRKSLTTSANEAAEKVTEQARKSFETSTKNRQAKVKAQKDFEKKAVHLENNVKQAKKTRDTLKESVDDLKALRKKDGTMAGHQQIVDKYGSVEKLDAVISRTEAALKTSRERLRDVQTNLGTEKKRLQRANAKIDKEFPVEAKGIKGETKVEPKEVKAAITETKPKTTSNRKIEMDNEGGLVLRDENGNRQPLDQESVDNLNKLIAERTESANKAADLAIDVKRAEKKKNDAWKLYEQNNKAFVARDKEATSLERFQEWQKELNEQHLAYDKAKLSHDKLKQELDLAKKNVDTVETLLKDEQRRIESGGFREVGDDEINWTKDSAKAQEVYAGNREVVDSSKVQGTIDKTAKEAEPPKEMPKKGEPNYKERGLVYKFYKAIFNDLESFDEVGRKAGGEAGEHVQSRTNAVRLAKSSASAKVSEGLDIFKKAGLVGKKNRARMNDFQEYAWLKHDAEIFDNDPSKEFLGYHKLGNKVEDSRKAIADRMAELEEKYKMPEEWHNKVANLEKKIAETTDEKQRAMFERQLNGLMKQDQLHTFQKDLVKYFDELLDMEVDAGLSSKEFADGLRKKYENYVPKFVEKEFDESVTKTFKDELDIAKGMRAAMGNDGQGLVPMYEQMVAKTNAVYKRTELNRLTKAVAEVWGVSSQDLDLVKAATKATDEDVAESIMDVAVFTPKAKDGNYKIFYYENGDKHVLPVPKDMYDDIRNWTGEQKKMLVEGSLFFRGLEFVNDKLVAPVARLWKDFITDYSLIFAMKNHPRDLATALFYTKDIKGYTRNLPKAYKSVANPKRTGLDKELYDAYVKNGGVHTQLVTSGKFDNKYYKGMLKRVGKGIEWGTGLRVIREINAAAEMIPRYAEYLSAVETNALKKAGKESLDQLTSAEYEKYVREVMKDPDAIANSVFRAKDVTLNFDRGGWFGKKLNRGIVPFFNPSVQGIDKLMRELTTSNIVRDEMGNVQMFGKKLNKNGEVSMRLLGGTAAAFGFELAKLGLMVGAPVALINGMFGDYYEGKVDGYGALSDYNKYTYYNIPVGDGKYLKIPRARELAAMQDGVDWAFHHFKYGDGQTPGSPLYVDTTKKDLANLGRISWEQVGPVDILEDNLFAQGYRAFKGKTWYGSEIETEEDRDKIAAGKSNEVWDENTSWLAKQLGDTDGMKKINMSPKKIDNVLDSYLGVIYDAGISQWSAKNEVRWKANAEQHGPLGGILGFGKSVAASAFMIDSVFQNRYKADNFNKKTILKDEIEKLESDGKKWSNEWKKANATLNRINNAYAYNSIQFDETNARIYLSGNSATDKKKATRIMAENQTKMFQAESDGKVTSPVDPLAVVYNIKNSKGKHILSTMDMLEGCSYTSKDDFGNETNSIVDAFKEYRKGKGSDSKFVKTTLAARDVARAAGASLTYMSWRTNAFAAELNGLTNVDDVLKAYGDSNIKYSKDDAKLYKQYKGTLKTYKQSSKDITQSAYDLGLPYASKMEQWDKANTLSSKHHLDREYFAQSQFHKGSDGTYYGYDAFVIKNAARCLASDKYKKNWHGKPTAEVSKFCMENNFTYKDGKHPDPKKVETAIRKKYGDKYTDEERAAVFYEICPWADNPFGEIGDYSMKGDTGINPSSGYGGGGRGRRRGRGGRGRGGSGGGNGRGNAVAVPTATKMGNYKVHDFTFKSNVNDAYRRKVKKSREDLRKKTSKAVK